MKLNLRARTVMPLAALAVAVTSFGALANEADVQYRKATMTALGGHVRALATIVQGKVAHDDQLTLHAKAIGDMAKIVPTIFPKGSDGGGTDAKAAIWENPEEFQKVVDTFAAAASKIGSASDKQAVAAAFGELGASCKACHQTYKK